MPEVIPEVVTLIGAPLVAYIVGGLKSALGAEDRASVLLTIGVGVLVAGLIYGAGFVAGDGLSAIQFVARIALAGIGMAMAASGGRSWARADRPTAPPPSTPSAS